MAICELVDLVIAACANLTVMRGDNLTVNIEFFEDEAKQVPYDLTQWDAFAMQIKRRTTDSSPLVTASLNDGLTIGGSHELRIDIPGARMDIARGNYVYDVEASDANEVRTILNGSVTVEDDVTR